MASDLDGTLLGPDGRVSPRTARALLAAADAGVEVVFVTARPPRWLVELAPYVARHGAAICANGAAVVEVASLRVVEQHGMDAPLVAELARRARAALGQDEVQLAVESVRGFATEDHYRGPHDVPPGTPTAERIEDVLDDATLKLLVRTTTPRPDLHAALAVAFEDLATVAHSGVDDLGEVSRPDVSKATTLATWLAARGVEAEDVWALGDAANDLPMLTWAGRSFAMGNAAEHVRATADEVVATNADDGAAQVLERAVALTRASGSGGGS